MRGLIGYGHLLLGVAGLGGLLYGIDVGVIAAALPYVEATTRLGSEQLSIVVAAVLFGSVFSTLFAGAIADGIGRKQLMVASGLLFVASIPVVALSNGYAALVVGRLLQGISAGLIGVVVPLYLAECLGPLSRGRGTAIFQWFLTLGILIAAIIGIVFSLRGAEIAGLGDKAKLLAFQNIAWRGIFWVCLPPGVLFVIGSVFLGESPRWLLHRGKRDAALNALLLSRTADHANQELSAMENAAAVDATRSATGNLSGDSLLRQKYLAPFLLACTILACNQATGINSIIGYNTDILLESGLTDLQAHWGYVWFTTAMFFGTLAGVQLIDRVGRRLLLLIGTAGLVVLLLVVARIFAETERGRVDVRGPLQDLLSLSQTKSVLYDLETAQKLLAIVRGPRGEIVDRPTSLSVVYSCGDFSETVHIANSSQTPPQSIVFDHQHCVPANRTLAFLSNPFGSIRTAPISPIRIENAFISPVPSEQSARLIEICLWLIAVFFSFGPGVCVWLSLSELMPSRIRSSGMSVALVINQALSTFVAAIFLPTEARYGYATMFLIFACCTGLYLFVVLLFLPETRGKTLEEIERTFASSAT